MILFRPTGAIQKASSEGGGTTAAKGAEDMRPAEAARVALERSSPAVEAAAVVPEELASRCGRHLGPGFPSHTCTADRRCRIASGPPTQPRRPAHSR